VSGEFIAGDLVDQYWEVGLDAGSFETAERLTDTTFDELARVDGGELLRENACDLVEARMRVVHPLTMRTAT